MMNFWKSEFSDSISSPSSLLVSNSERLKRINCFFFWFSFNNSRSYSDHLTSFPTVCSNPLPSLFLQNIVFLICLFISKEKSKYASFLWTYSYSSYDTIFLRLLSLNCLRMNFWKSESSDSTCCSSSLLVSNSQRLRLTNSSFS